MNASFAWSCLLLHLFCLWTTARAGARRACRPSDNPSGSSTYCPVLAQPSNGQVTTYRHLGATATYTCNAGYAPYVQRQLHCTECEGVAVWDNKPSTCLQSCEPLTALSNGYLEVITVNQNGDPYSTIRFHCNDGYELGTSQEFVELSDTSMCLNGRWTNTVRLACYPEN